MKSGAIFQAIVLAGLLTKAASGLGGCVIYTPPRTDCIPRSDLPQYRCETHTFSADGEEIVTKDIVTHAALAEEASVEAVGIAYAKQFALSTEQGYRIASAMHDLDKLGTRTDNDIKDFAKRLYGLNPQDILTAASRAQFGDPEGVKALTRQAASNFGVDEAKMHRIVKTLHGKLLESQGIDY